MVSRECTAVWQVPFSKWVDGALLSGTRRRFTCVCAPLTKECCVCACSYRLEEGDEGVRRVAVIGACRRIGRKGREGKDREKRRESKG